MNKTNADKFNTLIIIPAYTEEGIQFDGDGQHKAEYLPRLICAIKQGDCDVA